MLAGGVRADAFHDVNVDPLASRVVIMIFILNPATCLAKAGNAGRQPQMMPHVTSATLQIVSQGFSAFDHGNRSSRALQPWTRDDGLS